jgi:hypothetical protein
MTLFARGAMATPAFAVQSLSVMGDDDCPPLCAGSCVKPIVIPDRWDDVTPLPGHEAWTRNGLFDAEDFTDVSRNGLYDPGEPFVDSNQNGRYDAEAYHPVLTGFIPDPYPGNFLAGPTGDLGRLIHLRPSKDERMAAFNYYAVAYPATNKGTPRRGARAFRDALESCVDSYVEKGDWVEVEPGSMAGPTYEALRVTYEKDPDARWDPGSNSIVGSKYALMPRLVLLALSDPRIGPTSGRSRLQIMKIAAFFFEAPSPDGVVLGRFLKARAPGVPCSCTCESAEAFLRDCP